LGALRLDATEKLMDKSLQMEMYLLEQTSDVFHMYSKQMNDEIRLGGHTALDTYFMTLEAMDDENRKPWEQRLWAEISELRMI